MKAIFHADREWGIGKKNDLMFSLPLDMKFFRETTKDKIIVMGRNTLNSFPNGKPLKNRVNIVLSSKKVDEDVIAVHNSDELFEELNKYPEDDVYVIGGASVYNMLMPYCSEVLVTKVDAVGGADAFFENLDQNPNFKLAYESAPEETNGYTVRFLTYKNLNVKPY